MDIVIQRTFRIAGRLSFSFRFESFDVFDLPNFYNPLGTLIGELGESFCG